MPTFAGVTTKQIISWQTESYVSFNDSGAQDAAPPHKPPELSVPETMRWHKRIVVCPQLKGTCRLIKGIELGASLACHIGEATFCIGVVPSQSVERRSTELNFGNPA